MKRCVLVLLLCAFSLVALAGENHFLLKVLPQEGVGPHRDGYIPVAVEENVAIDAAHPGGGMWIPLSGGAVHLEYRDQIVHPDGTWTFIGAISDVANSPKAMLTFGDHAVFGTIPTPSGQIFALTTLDGRTWLAGHSRDAGAAIRPPRRGQNSLGVATQAAGAKPHAMAGPATPPPAATPDKPATVDLLVVYTPEFVAQFGSLAAATTFIRYQVDNTNQAFNDSLVYGRIRLVKIAPTTIPDSLDSVTALTNLEGNTAVAALRNQYGADAVVMAESTIGGCRGAGIQLGANLTPIPLGPGKPAYLVWGDDGTGTCDTGIPGYGLASGLGSDFGLAMQPGVPTGEPGAYTFSYAYQKAGTSKPAQGTLEIGGLAIWPYFSNPNINLCDGGPCGVPDVSDAARSLNLTLPIIATFAPTKVMPRNDLNGDHDSDLLWMNAASSTFGEWLMDGQQVVGLSAIAITPGYTIAATSDFNGDGKTDLVWTNTAVTQYPDLYLWTSTGSGFTSTEIGAYSADDRLVGAGVFDVDDEGYGSGNADLIFLNQKTNTFGWWVMQGATILRKWSTQIAPGYTIAAVGDFNGDGRTDIVWTSAAHDLYLWTWASHGFNAQYIGTYPAGWQSVGAGDVDGDGDADLVWTNPATGGFGYWLMNGATIKTIWSTTVSSAYRIAALGDFNGDGMTDVMWTSAARDLYLWTSNGVGFDAQYVGTYPQGWDVVPSQVMANGLP